MFDTTFMLHFLGWCTLINIGLLLFSTLILVGFNARIKQLHQSFFALSEQQLDNLYIHFLAIYKIAIIFFNLIPYLVLRFLS